MYVVDMPKDVKSIGLDEFLNGAFDDQVTPRHKPPENRCWTCDIELSSTLDAYYGHDGFLGRLCSKCRTAEEKGTKP